MSFNGDFAKCNNCAMRPLPDSIACTGCYAGRNFRPERKSKYNYGSHRNVTPSSRYLDSLIEKVIFNPPATIVLWKDGFPKTVVKCQEGDTYDREKGLAMCITKRCAGNRGSYCDIFKKWCGDNESIHNKRRELRDRLLMLAAAEFQAMVDNNVIDRPMILCSEDTNKMLKYVASLVDDYINNPDVFTEDFHDYITAVFKHDYGKEPVLWKKENPHINKYTKGEN